MAKYRKKPVVIDAIQWDGLGNNADKFIGERYGTDWEYAEDGSSIRLPTLEGTMICKAGDWIIRGIKGEYYPCRADVFAETYEAVGDV